MQKKMELIEDKRSNFVTTKLTKEQFRDFMAFLQIIRHECNDLWIENGEFRSRSNSHTCLFETGFSYFEDFTFLIANIPMIIKLLSVLDKNTEILISADNTDIIFRDGYQVIKIKKFPFKFSDNPFVEDETMSEIFYDYINAQNHLVSETLPKAIVYNIEKMVQNLNTESICVEHNEGDLNKGHFYVSGPNAYSSKSKKDFDEYFFKLKKPFLQKMKQNHYFTLNSLPFIFNKSDMIINCYFSNSDEIILTICTVTVGKLIINIYSRAQYREKDD